MRQLDLFGFDTEPQQAVPVQQRKTAMVLRATPPPPVSDNATLVFADTKIGIKIKLKREVTLTDDTTQAPPVPKTGEEEPISEKKETTPPVLQQLTLEEAILELTKETVSEDNVTEKLLAVATAGQENEPAVLQTEEAPAAETTPAAISVHQPLVRPSVISVEEEEAEPETQAPLAEVPGTEATVITEESEVAEAPIEITAEEITNEQITDEPVVDESVPPVATDGMPETGRSVKKIFVAHPMPSHQWLKKPAVISIEEEAAPETAAVEVREASETEEVVEEKEEEVTAIEAEAAHSGEEMPDPVPEMTTTNPAVTEHRTDDNIEEVAAENTAVADITPVQQVDPLPSPKPARSSLVRPVIIEIEEEETEESVPEAVATTPVSEEAAPEAEVVITTTVATTATAEEEETATVATEEAFTGITVPEEIEEPEEIAEVAVTPVAAAEEITPEEVMSVAAETPATVAEATAAEETPAAIAEVVTAGETSVATVAAPVTAEAETPTPVVEEPEPVTAEAEPVSVIASEAETEVAPVVVPPVPPPAKIKAPRPPAMPKKRGRKSFKEIDAETDLIQLPDDEALFEKQYYPISVVAGWFNVNASLLRFWENEFDILKPRKNRKGDRLFRPEDVKNLQVIYYLLRQRKFTIEGAKEYLKTNKKKADTNTQLIQSLTKLRGFLLEFKANLHP